MGDFFLVELRDKKSFVYFTHGTYALMLYYAKQIDASKADILYYITINEYMYRYIKNMPLDGFSVEDDYAHFDINEYNMCINFIDSQIIPAISSETQDILDKYGGKSTFIDLIYSETGFFEGINLFDADEFHSDPLDLINRFKRFRYMIKNAIDNNSPYEVFLVT